VEGHLDIAGFERVAEIGRGGFAVVYRAWQPGYRRTVAIKVLGASGMEDDARSPFEAELQAMGSLSGHPHIVTLFDHGVTRDGSPYLVMGFEEGGSLSRRLRISGPMTWEEAGAVGVKMAGALETAHRAGLLHRDVKPENVLLSAYGEPKLADFGIARLQGSAVGRTEGLLASIPHAAPELLEGAPPSVATDVYALGSTVYTLMRGRPAFVTPAGGGSLPLISRIGIEPVPDLRPSGVPDAVCAVLERAMAKNPGDRPRSARAFAQELRAAAAGGGVSWPEPLVREADPFHGDELGEPPREAGPPAAGDRTAVLRRWTPRGIEARIGRRWASLAGAAMVVLLALVTVLSSAIIGAPASWSSRASMPTSRFLHAVTTGRDGLVYVIGGTDWTADGGPLATVIAYDPRTSTWGDIAPLHSGRWGAAAVTARDGSIVVIGGVGHGAAQHNALASVEAYSPPPRASGWSDRAPLPAPRRGLAAVTASDGAIWAIGGFGEDDRALDTVEIYDQSTDTWRPGPPLRVGRGDLAAVAVPDGRIYAVGGDVRGADGRLTDVNTVEVWSPATHAWRDAAPLPTGCSSPAVVAGASGEVYAIGGLAGASALTGVEQLQGNRWVSVAPLSLARATAATASADGTLYIVGGLDLHNRAVSIVEAFRRG
jgi:N-acetylneuraminic acid mutarotase